MQQGITSAEVFAGLPCHRLTLPCGDSLLVAEHGAHVLSWTVQGTEQLFLSPLAIMDGKAAIRGGVPICLPQFNQRGTLPKHGFMRNLPWVVNDACAEGNSQQVVLRLSSGEVTRTIWPIAFEAVFTLDLSPGALQMTIALKNLGEESFPFSGALHTYLAVEDIARTQLTGLGGQPEWNALTDTHGRAAPLLEFAGEFDRVYAATPGALRLVSPKRELTIHQSESWANTVVWNPGKELCSRMADMPSDGYAHMVCVEAAQVTEPIVLAPEGLWQGWQRLVSTMEAC